MINFFNKRIYILFVFPILLGALSVLSFQPFNFFFINFFTLPVLFWLIVYVKKKSKNVYRKKPFIQNLFYLGSSYGFGFFLSNLHWIVYSMTFDETFRIFIPFGLFLIPVFLSLFFSLPIVISGYFVDDRISSVFLISLFFGLSDFLRSIIFTGFPWNLWVYSLSFSIENLQLLYSLGFFSLNLVVITLYFLPAAMFFKNINKYIVLGILIIISLSNYFYGSYVINTKSDFNQLERKVNFKIVSAGLNLYEFTDPIDVTKKLIKFSEPDKEKSTIFVWPEGTFMSENFLSSKKINKIRQLFKKNFSDNHFIILGLNTVKKNNSQKNYYNSMILVNNNLDIISQYDKKKLVPFGEFLPFENILNKIGMKKITPGYTSFSNGQGLQNIQLNFDQIKVNFLPLICYEIIFPSFIENIKSDYNFVINISEDAWFGKSIGPHQHFAKAIFRSIESRKFLLRSANKGKSAFLDPYGKVIKVLNPIEAGNIEFQLPLIESSKNQYKKSLIFYLLLFTYILTFLLLRKFEKLK